MKPEDIQEFRRELAQMQQMMQQSCDTGCVEDEDSFEDYPDYLKAIYHEIMPPVKSGIYFSRWDLKNMATLLDESFALDVRERMFRKFMQWIKDPDDMKRVVEIFKDHIDMKCELYREYSEKYPSTKEIFDEHIKKADRAKRYLDKVYKDFFT